MIQCDVCGQEIFAGDLIYNCSHAACATMAAHPTILGIHGSGQSFTADCKHVYELSRESRWEPDVWLYRCEKCGFSKTRKVKQEDIRLIEE